MIGLHVLHDQVIGGAISQRIADVVQPFVGKGRVHRIHDGNKVVKDRVGVVAHTVGYAVLTLKQVDLAVVYADVLNVLGDVHMEDLLYRYYIIS